MAKIDMHVHSMYSEHPSDWFLQRLGARESYSSPEFIFDQAMQKGMDFVTITDHNRIDGVLLLKDKYPDKVITGLEATTYFPEDGCKLHLLIYGFNPREFEKIQQLRPNVYKLRDYLLENNIAHSLAHATYSVNGRLRIEHLEKLVLLFDVFEGINGARARINSQPWSKLLAGLTPEKLRELEEKHGIKPCSENSWIKGITGGTDDHSGLFVADTYTVAQAGSPAQLVDAIKQRTTSAGGRYNNYLGFAFAIYKIAFDFSKHRFGQLPNSATTMITEMIFKNEGLSLRERLKIKKIKYLGAKNKVNALVVDLVEHFSKPARESAEQRFEFVYNRIAEICDVIFINFIKSMREHLSSGDLNKFFRSLSSCLASAFLSVPFFSAMHHMNRERTMIKELEKQFNTPLLPGTKRVLWFVEDIQNDAGVMGTVKNFADCTNDNRLVVCGKKNKLCSSWPAIELEQVCDFDLPGIKGASVLVPSLLKSVKQLHDADPDEVVITSSGPLGLLGLLLARLANIPVRAVHHEAFSLLARGVCQGDVWANGFARYNTWLFSLVEGVYAPDCQSRLALEHCGISPERIIGGLEGCQPSAV